MKLESRPTLRFEQEELQRLVRKSRPIDPLIKASAFGFGVGALMVFLFKVFSA